MITPIDYALFTLLGFSLAAVFTIGLILIFRRGKSLSKTAYPVDLNSGAGKILSSLWQVNKAILSALSLEELEKLTEKVVNVIINDLNYEEIGYKVSVLTLLDEKEGVVRRISFSPTPEAYAILQKTNISFKDIKVPINTKENLLVRSIEDQKIYITHDSSDVFYPNENRETWREVQQRIGIKTSLIFPLIVRDKSIGAMIFSLSKSESEISDYEKGLLGGFVDAVAVALSNSQLYMQLRAANEKLQMLDKRKDEFLSVAAHELRAPMTAIKGYLSMIVEGDTGEVGKETKEFLLEAIEGNDRLVRLVNNMLNVSRIEEGRLVFEMGTVSLIKVVQTVFNEFKVEAEQKGLTYNLNITATKDSVYVDPDRIHEVVANFISNAIKYTDKGSIQVNLIQLGIERIRFEVTDTGPGIAEAEQQKLFQKSFRAESSMGKKMGTGLGLYISKLLVEKFNGTLGLTSKVGNGSTFWFELPVV